MPKPPDETSPASSSRTGGVQSVDRALSILEVLGEDEEGHRLTHIAQRTGLSPSTVHRLLTSLERRRFVQFDHSTGTWHVGRTAFAVGSAFVRQRNFVAPALPFLRRLRDQTRETANLGVVDEGEMVVLTQIESREIMRAITRVGGRAPMVSSGMGKATLATYSADDVTALVKSRGLRRVTPNTISTRQALSAELDVIRRQGYAVDDEEFATGLRCIAAVVYNHQGEALCAISVSGLAQRLTRERIPSIGQLVSDTAREMTLALGGRPPFQNEP